MAKTTRTKSKKSRKVDPVTVEIVRNGVLAVTEEMKTNLMRTAYNMIIYEALDFTTGLFTAEGETVSIGIGLPTFIRGMAETVKAKIRHFGFENMKPGDIYVTNDSYITGSHLNHFTFTLPIFHKNKLVGFSCCMAHWLDVGGVLGGMTTDIYSEGIQIPILKYQDRGKVNQDLLDIIRINVRLPPRAMGDLRAQVTAVKTGERRFLELLDRYGQQAVLDSIAEIMDRAEVAARARTRTIPDGVYEAESFLDDDGIEIGKRISVKVRVIVKGEEMTIDFTDVSKQVRGFFNSAITTGYGCAQVAYKCITSPTDYPINDGAFRSLKVIIPPGRIISATRPAPMRWWMTFPMTIVDTVFKALQPAMPDKVIAAHHADLVVASINGYLPRDGKLFIYVGGLIGGGWGAKASEDGVGATIAINDGDTHNGPSEQVEVKYPLLVERYGLYEDSGGPGRFRGGLGTVQTVRARHDIMLNAQIERVNCRPWGLAGGLSGAGNQVTVRRAGGEEEYFPSGKVLSQSIRPGDSFTLRSGGGGGYGSPLERDPAAVEEDVIQGYVSREKAAAVYGVVFAPDGERIDLGATARRRAEMRAAGRPQDDDGLTEAGRRTREAAEKAAAAEAALARPPAAPDHLHGHGFVRGEDDYELRLQLALARRCC
jgi:N-methylhydantoinase B